MFFRYDQDDGGRYGQTRIVHARAGVPRQGWHYDTERGITVTVLIEAQTPEAANERARRIGIDFTPEAMEPPRFEARGGYYYGTPPPMLHRWVEVIDEMDGFDSPGEALGDSDDYELFNPWLVAPSFNNYWPVFVHTADGCVRGTEAFVDWYRGDFDMVG